MKLSTHFANLYLPRSELGQARVLFRYQNQFHLLKERRTTSVIRHLGVKQVDIQRALFKLPRTYAAGLYVITFDTFGIELGFGVDEQVALLG